MSKPRSEINKAFYKTLPARLAKAEAHMKASQERDEAYREATKDAREERRLKTREYIKTLTEKANKND